MNDINEYQRDQVEDYRLVVNHINSLSSEQKFRLLTEIQPYLEFREEVDAFLADHFASVCTATCFQNRLSACCAKDSIIIFFADVVVNSLISNGDEIIRIMKSLTTTNTGGKCVYLGPDGCKWHMKPIVCATFLCDRAETEIFAPAPQLREKWDELREKEKKFKWPDQPVLFDKLEAVFIDAGYNSPSMFLHNSPGLLRVKRMAGL